MDAKLISEWLNYSCLPNRITFYKHKLRKRSQRMWFKIWIFPFCQCCKCVKS